MGNFFSMENPLFQGLYKIAECVFLSLLWMIFCIPLFTAGTATTAMYYTIQKCLKNDRGYVFSCFWESFKANFKTGTALSVIFLIVAFVGITDWSVLDYLRESQVISGYAAEIFFLVLLFIAAIYALWVFAVLARFDNNWKKTMRNALLLATGHWQITLMMAGILILSALIIYIIPFTAFIMPVVCIWLISAPLEKVFRLYMEDSDKRLEDELNMRYHNDYDDSPAGGKK